MSLYERHADELLSDNTHNAGYEQCKNCVYSGKPGTAAYSRCICEKYPLTNGNDQWATCKPDGIEDSSEICQHRQIKKQCVQ